MKPTIKAIFIVIVALIVFAGLIYTKIYVDQLAKKKSEVPKNIANLTSLQNAILADSLYTVRQVLYRDSAIVIAVDNPAKSGTESYFDRKFKINGYDNINMVYIYKYDSLKSLATIDFDAALMAKGKKMGRFQQEWVSRYIDTLDGSCKPLRAYLSTTLIKPGSFKNEETTYQPASIHNMQVECKFRGIDSLGKKNLYEVTAVVGADGKLALVNNGQ